MQQNIRRKLTKFAAIGLSGAMLLLSTPLTFADAAETQSTVVTNTQEVAKQALQSYLADANGYMVYNATEEQVQLPFEGELYYGRSLLSEDGKQVFDVVIRNLLAFSPKASYEDGVTYGIANDGRGRMTFELSKFGIEAHPEDIKKIGYYFQYSEPRMFHLHNYGQEYTKNPDGTLKTVTFYIAKAYANNDTYQEALFDMEKKTTEYLSLVDDRMTDAQKAKILFEKFNDATDYVVGAEGQHDMRGPLLSGKAICGGYSYAFQYILQRAGIPAIFLTGNTAVGYHAWNYFNIDGEWYFADSTWGGTYFFKGKSALNTHPPLQKQHFEPVPTLAEKDFNINDAVFVDVERNTINAIKEEVRKVLNYYLFSLDYIDEVYVSVPSKLQMVGSETDMDVAERIRKAIQGKIGENGIAYVSLSNHGYNFVSQFLENGLYIGYQQSEDSPYFEYRNGKIERY